MEKVTQAIRYLLILLLKMYRFCISPFIGQHCRFLPTCSHYAEQAVFEHGVFYGIYLTIRRLLRCHPWHYGGYDPVPKTKHK